jgi:N-acetylmuramoyl-L-alanine amidase
MIVLHHTGMPSAGAALARLCDPAAQVSAHYLVDEGGRVLALVPEARRAWHAGTAHWAGITDVNSASIGIEMHNAGAEPYPRAQVGAVIQLCQAVMARWPIRWVLAHSDVAPARKADPGAQFPWARLAAAGVGVMPRPSAAPAPDARAALLALGYDPTCSMTALVRAFQRHWAPPVTGRACARTRAALGGLLSAL